MAYGTLVAKATAVNISTWDEACWRQLGYAAWRTLIHPDDLERIESDEPSSSAGL